MVRCPVRLPTAAGWNVTSGVQVPWPAMVVHVSETLKSPSVASPLTETTLARVLVSVKPAPVTEMSPKTSVALPTLVITKRSGALVVPTSCAANAPAVGETCRIGAEASWPVPASATPCGLPEAVLVIVTAPVRAPAMSGVNVTLNVHVAPAASDAPQVEVNAKSPLTVIEEITIGTEPLLVSVTVCARLVVETVRVGNVSDEGVKVSLGAQRAPPFDAADRGPVPTALVADTLNV